MYQMKGFIRIPSLADNVPGVVAPLGELSTYAATYAKEKGIYVHSVNGNEHHVNLVTFVSRNDTGPLPADRRFTDYVLELSQWLYDTGLTTDWDESASEIVRKLNNRYPDLVGTNAGRVVQDGQLWLPEWVSFRIADSTLEANEIKLWFADAAFRRQYDEYEIHVIPPLLRLDDFFDSAEAVQEKLAARPMAVLVDESQTIADRNPYSLARVMEYDWHEPANNLKTLNTNWMILVYGEAGNSVDLIQDAIIAYIEANTQRTRDEWIEIFPDIFKTTEFTLIPMWHRFALPDRALATGVYSPTTSVKEALDLTHAICKTYPSAHRTKYTCVNAVVYNSLNVVSCGGPENRNQHYQLSTLMPDYIAVQTTSPDFNRMSPKTQGWVRFLNNLLLGAEVLSPNSDVPIGFTRLVRDNVLYLVGNYDKVQYLAVTKHHMITKYGT